MLKVKKRSKSIFTLAHTKDLGAIVRNQNTKADQYSNNTVIDRNG